MDEIISLVVANGLFAVLFCGLLVYQLRDSRQRERKYTQTISELTDSLKSLSAVKTDTEAILADVREIKRGVRGARTKAVGAECVKTSA